MHAPLAPAALKLARLGQLESAGALQLGAAGAQHLPPMPLPLAVGVEAAAAVEVAAGEAWALVGVVGERISARIAPTHSTFAIIGHRGPCPLLAVGRHSPFRWSL